MITPIYEIMHDPDDPLSIDKFKEWEKYSYKTI